MSLWKTTLMFQHEFISSTNCFPRFYVSCEWMKFFSLQAGKYICRTNIIYTFSSIVDKESLNKYLICLQSIVSSPFINSLQFMAFYIDTRHIWALTERIVFLKTLLMLMTPLSKSQRIFIDISYDLWQIKLDIFLCTFNVQYKIKRTL